MQDFAKLEQLDKLVKRCDATISTKHPRDAWHTFLVKNSPSHGTTMDMEMAFFASKGGTGKTLQDLISSYLNSKGYSGTLSDKISAFCNAASSF